MKEIKQSKKLMRLQHHTICESSQAIDTNLPSKYQLNQLRVQKDKILTCMLSAVYFSTFSGEKINALGMTMIVNFATIG